MARGADVGSKGGSFAMRVALKGIRKLISESPLRGARARVVELRTAIAAKAGESAALVERVAQARHELQSIEAERDALLPDAYNRGNSQAFEKLEELTSRRVKCETLVPDVDRMIRRLGDEISSLEKQLPDAEKTLLEAALDILNPQCGTALDQLPLSGDVESAWCLLLARATVLSRLGRGPSAGSPRTAILAVYPAAAAIVNGPGAPSWVRERAAAIVEALLEGQIPGGPADE